MRVLQVLIHPDTIAGTERTTHVGTGALRAMGVKVFLLHDEVDTPRTAEWYDGSLGLPLIFDGRSKFSPRGLREAELQVDEFIYTSKIDLIHIHSYPRVATYRRLVGKYCAVTGVHVPLCPNGARYFWKERRPCDRKIGFGCLTTGYCRKGCGHLGNGVPVSPLAFLRMMVTDYLLHHVIARSMGIIANSSWLRDRLIADGVSAEPISVVHGPMENPPHAAEWVAPEKPPVVLFVGRLVDMKAPDHVLEASALMSVPHRVWIVGDGPLRSSLEAQARSLGIEGRVKFYGNVEPSEIVKLRSQSTLAVVPSVWPENFGRVGPESLLAQRPVVAYRVGGNPECVADGVNGRLVPVGDIVSLSKAMQEIISDPQLAREMGENGVRYATELTATKHGIQLREVYEKALASWRCRQSGAVLTSG